MNKSMKWVQANDYLNQVEDILYQLEVKKREPLDKFLIVAIFRILYFLLSQWVKEHDI